MWRLGHQVESRFDVPISFAVCSALICENAGQRSA